MVTAGSAGVPRACVGARGGGGGGGGGILINCSYLPVTLLELLPVEAYFLKREGLVSI